MTFSVKYGAIDNHIITRDNITSVIAIPTRKQSVEKLINLLMAGPLELLDLIEAAPASLLDTISSVANVMSENEKEKNQSNNTTAVIKEVETTAGGTQTPIT